MPGAQPESPLRSASVRPPSAPNDADGGAGGPASPEQRTWRYRSSTAARSPSLTNSLTSFSRAASFSVSFCWSSRSWSMYVIRAAPDLRFQSLSTSASRSGQCITAQKSSLCPSSTGCISSLRDSYAAEDAAICSSRDSSCASDSSVNLLSCVVGRGGRLAWRGDGMRCEGRTKWDGIGMISRRGQVTVSSGKKAWGDTGLTSGRQKSGRDRPWHGSGTDGGSATVGGCQRTRLVQHLGGRRVLAERGTHVVVLLLDDTVLLSPPSRNVLEQRLPDAPRLLLQRLLGVLARDCHHVEVDGRLAPAMAAGGSGMRGGPHCAVHSAKPAPHC